MLKTIEALLNDPETFREARFFMAKIVQGAVTRWKSGWGNRGGRSISKDVQ